MAASFHSVDVEPLPPPILYPARIVQGEVQSPGDTMGTQSNLTMNQDELRTAPPPSDSLERSSSLTGIILVAETPEGERAYWLQRKMCKTLRGSVRLGYRVANTTKSGAMWTVQPATNGPYPFEMVAIKVQNKAACEHVPKACRDPKVEQSALQLVTEHDPQGLGTVVTGLICADNDNIFMIMPYFNEGTLAEYVAKSGRLTEAVARHFFQQIVSGLRMLQQLGLCHHDLSLESVLLRGTDCFIAGLGLSLRVPVQEDGQLPILLSPQTSCGTQLLYLAPEILKNVPFDGFATDLWAAGVMLAIMLFGPGAPFVWASPDDKRYREISFNGNLRDVARRWESRNHGVTPVSEEALDLLQSMLRANPAERLNLKGIEEHPWFLADASPPLMSTVSIQNLG